MPVENPSPANSTGTNKKKALSRGTGTGLYHFLSPPPNRTESGPESLPAPTFPMHDQRAAKKRRGTRKGANVFHQELEGMMPGSGMQTKRPDPDSVRAGTPRGQGASMRPETGVRPIDDSTRRSSSARPPGSRFQVRRWRRRRFSGGSRSPGRESRRRR